MNNREEMSEGMTPKLPLWSYQVQSDSKLAVRTRKDLEIDLITRALKDEAFKQELLANPKVVVENELGTKLPEELEINVLEETEDTLYMVLPCNPHEGMSEEELKAALGMTYEDVAQWVLEEQRKTLLDEASSVVLIAQAWKYETFKQELLSNPKRVVEKELTEIIPAAFEINVLEESTHCLYIVLPKAADNFDLPDQEWLESSISNMNLQIAIGSVPISTQGCHTQNCTNTVTCVGTLGCPFSTLTCPQTQKPFPFCF